MSWPSYCIPKQDLDNLIRGMPDWSHFHCITCMPICKLVGDSRTTEMEPIEKWQRQWGVTMFALSLAMDSVSTASSLHVMLDFI
jgi:hypothetical protein